MKKVRKHKKATRKNYFALKSGYDQHTNHKNTAAENSARDFFAHKAVSGVLC